jgi:hypothetical protein
MFSLRFRGSLRRPKQAAGRAERRALRVEQLEDRRCLSCTVTVSGNTLRITGDGGNNNVAIVDNGAAGIVVTCDGVASPAATGIKRVLVNTGDGNDTLTYARSAAGGNFTTDLSLNARLGDGDDAFTADFNGNDLVGSARVKFDIEGNAGADMITFNAGTGAAPVDIASMARLELEAKGGHGNDTSTVNYAGDLDGKLTVEAKSGNDNDTSTAIVALGAGSTGALKAEVKGNDGDDDLTLTVTGPIAGAAKADLKVDGGDGNDLAMASYSGELDGKLSLKAKGGGGDDTVVATLALATGSTGSLKADVKGDQAEEEEGEEDEEGAGGGGNDDLTLTVPGPIAAGAKADLKVDGGDGNDLVTASYTGELDGKLSLKANGGDGDDTVAATLALATGSTGSVKADVQGDQVEDEDEDDADEDDEAAGGGNDTLTLTMTGPIAAGAKADLNVDGGGGLDKITTSYSGELDGELSLQASGGDDNDTVAAIITLAAGSTGSVKGAVNGGDGDDDLTFNITGATASVAIDATLDGGDGTDTCVATANVTVLNCP